MSASYDTKSYCRQSLIGGYYGLLDATTFRPNPDYYREEYHLTAEAGNLQSQTMLLNGEPLNVNSDGSIPVLTPNEVDGSQPIKLAPLSIVFALFPYLHAPACL
ncbi:Heparanase-like protein 3 [Platanthera zijinensis]|uniref:Heparanase-like protein 3 n=1 Tax=Platanthera zijinensis TaxID=2320716 RepID=A0AAP0B441_9ASPA